jgi:hypothetical protein
MIDTSTNRKHILFQVDKTTGLYKDLLIYRVGTNAKGTGDATTTYHTYKSQAFHLDKTGTTYNALYYVFIE